MALNGFMISVARGKKGHFRVSRTENSKSAIIAKEKGSIAPIIKGPIESATLSPNGKLLAVIVPEQNEIIIVDLQSLTQSNPALSRISLYEEYRTKKVRSISFNKESSRLVVLDEWPDAPFQSMIIFNINSKLSESNFSLDLTPVDISSSDGLWFGKLQVAPAQFKTVVFATEPDVVQLVDENGNRYSYNFLNYHLSVDRTTDQIGK